MGIGGHVATHVGDGGDAEDDDLLGHPHRQQGAGDHEGQCHHLGGAGREGIRGEEVDPHHHQQHGDGVKTGEGIVHKLGQLAAQPVGEANALEIVGHPHQDAEPDQGRRFE